MATAYPGGLRKRGGLLDNEDTIQATPRNAFFGGVADLLGQAYKLPEMPRLGVPGLDFMVANRNRLMDLLGVGDVQKTAEALSYGNRLGTGTGMTYQPLPETVGAALTVAPMVAPAARMVGKGAVETGRFVAPKVGQLAEQYMMNTGGILPLDVYHGSPHTFPPTPKNPLGEFDASKIGTGEGAQAYGHGIYVAEAPGVAKGYAEQLSTAQGPLGDVAKYWRKNGGESAFRAFAKDAGLPPAEIENTANVIRNTGNLYKVDLPDEKIAKMLDWDKPMTEQEMIGIYDKMQQSPLASFAKPFQDNFYESMNRGQPTTDGQDLFMELSKQLGGQKYVSDFLKSIDIPGIKYLDEGSRSAGKGTRNFVVFPGEEKSMTILERNGQRAEELKRLQAGGLLAP
jgi:hypothetical protein